MPRTEDDEDDETVTRSRRPKPKTRKLVSRSRRGTSGHSLSHWRASVGARLGEHGPGVRVHLEKYVPLASHASRHDVREHKLSFVGGGVGGGALVAVACSAGGTITGGLVTIGTAILLKAFSKKGRGSSAAAGVLIAGTLVCLANAIGGGSLTGTAKLGSTLRNLKAMSARVARGDLGIVPTAVLAGVGLTPPVLRRMGIQLPRMRGLGQLQLPTAASWQAQFAAWGKQLGLPALAPPASTQGRRALGDYFNGESYNPVSEVGARALESFDLFNPDDAGSRIPRNPPSAWVGPEPDRPDPKWRSQCRHSLECS